MRMHARFRPTVMLGATALVAMLQSAFSLPPIFSGERNRVEPFLSLDGVREQGGSPSNKLPPNYIRFDATKCTREGEPVLTGWDGRFSNRVAFHIEELLVNWQISQSQSTDNWQGMLQDIEISERLQNGIRKKYGSLDMFQHFEELFDKLSRAGFFQWIVKFESPSSESIQHKFKKMRRLEVSTSVQGLLRDFAFVGTRNFTCEERKSWPLSWHISSPSSPDLPSWTLQIRALPVRKEANGSYVIAKSPSRIQWSVLQETNLKFFEVNEFRAKVIVQNAPSPYPTLNSQFSIYFYELDERLLECSSEYERNCTLREYKGEGRLCSNWGSRCGIQDIIKINTRSFDGSGPSHVLYAVGRAAAAIVGNGSLTAQEYTQRLDNAFTSPNRARLASKKEALSMIDNMRSSRDYVPQLDQDQDLLTFLISVVTWAAEWIVSGPLWALQAWIILIRRILGCQQEILQEEVFQRREAGVFSRIRRQSLLILPAAVGLIPIVVGLVLAKRLLNASVGMMAGGYAVQGYDGVYDPDPQNALYNTGSTLSYTLNYTEDGTFNNLGTEYLVATCVASILLLFSLMPIVIIGLTSIKRGRSRSQTMLAQKNREDMEVD